MKLNKRFALTAWGICTAACTVFAQDDRKTDSIVAEGKKLYRSEMASWYGSDIFVEKFKEKRKDLGGYFSYADNDKTNCVFYSKGDFPQVIATVSFDSTYSVAGAQVDGNARELTAYEKEMYLVRRAALKVINEDTMFKTYENTSLNIIPIVEGDERKVYVLTGPQTTGIVIIGNDYLLTFDKTKTLLSKKQLHKNIIPIKFGKEEISSVHSHLPETGEYITATDVCTLLLYGRYTPWESHMVISDKFVSLWSFKTNSLVVLTREAWERISQDQEQKTNN